MQTDEPVQLLTAPYSFVNTFQTTLTTYIYIYMYNVYMYIIYIYIYI